MKADLHLLRVLGQGGRREGHRRSGGEFIDLQIHLACLNGTAWIQGPAVTTQPAGGIEAVPRISVKLRRPPAAFRFAAGGEAPITHPHAEELLRGVTAEPRLWQLRVQAPHAVPAHITVIVAGILHIAVDRSREIGLPLVEIAAFPLRHHHMGKLAYLRAALAGLHRHFAATPVQRHLRRHAAEITIYIQLGDRVPLLLCKTL